MGATIRQRYNRLRIRRVSRQSQLHTPYPHANHPCLLDRLTTLKTILDTEKSVSRFGDGELMLALLGRSIPFQQKNRELALQLSHVLNTPDPRVLVCMNNTFMQNATIPWLLDYERSKKDYASYESIRKTNDIGILVRAKEQRFYNECYRILFGRNVPGTFGEATVFMLGLYCNEYQSDRIDEVKALFLKMLSGKKLLIASPAKPLMEPSFQSLAGRLKQAGATHLQWVDIPENNAYAQYSAIKSSILCTGGFDAVWIQAGPTAALLAHDLAIHHDILAYDIGSFNTTLQYLI